MRYHFKTHKEADSYWAQGIELKGCFTQGRTKQELNTNMQEALNFYLSEPEDSKVIFPRPKKKVRGKNIVAIEVEPKVAMDMLVRTMRLSHKLTQQKAATELGMHLYAFQRLESPKSANPRWTTLQKLLKVFPDFPVKLLL